MTKDDLYECADLCDEWDELVERIRQMEVDRVVRVGFAKISFERKLQSLKKRKDQINGVIDGYMLEIDALPDLERRLIILHYFNGWSWKRVAEELGYSYDHVSGKLHKRALKLLRKKA